ncbi:IS110 family transposase [Pseudoroseomonas wenyumeiae]|uniref:IS110 family transposase n=1 Tax=Teichococcus wenyumeiae TaxID=2478470 RepID=A0A3A9J0V3_9PROT|nr:IS110 family transposase [Pseudoroseomonas wenyumeiae]RKK00102.1 IS110 family transposase [Pseudoroseomonas wenyumeiae]RMI13986.1 IS110 family transposase [Pseudoroseomonas wenyumeiae]
MRLYAALDVSLNKTAVCVMDHEGHLLREVEVATCPDALAEFLRGYADGLERVGLEAGPMSEWLVRGLAGHGIEAVLMETRQAHKALSAMTVKTDRNDARGLAHLLRMGWFRPVHVKTVSAREQRARISARETLIRQLRDLENSVRGLLRGFGLRMPPLLRAGWADAVRALIEGHPSLPVIFAPLLQAREALREQLASLDRQVRNAAREDPVCRRLMTVPGVGAIVALTYRSTIDDPGRFRSSRSVGAFLGLTPRRYQSGETDRVGAISKAGDPAARVALFEAAHVLLTRVARWSALKAWGMRLAQRRGTKRAKVALARKLAGILHRMWVSESDFRSGAPAAAMEG